MIAPVLDVARVLDASFRELTDALLEAAKAYRAWRRLYRRSRGWRRHVRRVKAAERRRA